MPPPPHPTLDRRPSTRQLRPPWRADSNPSDSSASQTSSQRERERKRKRDASQPRRSASVSAQSESAASGTAFSRAKSFPESVKNRIRNASSGDKCWLCGDVGRDVAHVIASSESKVSKPNFVLTPGGTRQCTQNLFLPQTLDRLKAVGLTNLVGLQKDDNGLPLCPNCHFQYDKPGDPGWVFFPADLKYFIEEEKKDVRRRKQSWREDGQVHFRVPPTAARYFEDQERKRKLLPGARAGSYVAYIIESFGPDTAAFMVGYNMTKAWHGDPMAAINKAFRGLTAGYLVLPTELMTLHRLYQDNDLQVRRLQEAPPTQHGDGGDPDNDDQEQRSQEDFSSSESEPPNQRRPTSTHQPRQSLRVMKLQERASGSERRTLGPEHDEPLLMLATSRNPRAVLQEEPFARSYPSKRVKVEEGCWEIGPATTAQEMIDFYSFFNGGGYVDNGPWAVAYPIDSKGKGTTTGEYGLLSPGTSDKPGGGGVLCETSKTS
ncbi:MAG: hypothetical protein Q9210_002460 [Variospora velana]